MSPVSPPAAPHPKASLSSRLLYLYPPSPPTHAPIFVSSPFSCFQCKQIVICVDIWDLVYSLPSPSRHKITNLSMFFYGLPDDLKRPKEVTWFTCGNNDDDDEDNNDDDKDNDDDDDDDDKDDSRSVTSVSLLRPTPLPGASLLSPAFLLWGWGCGILYLVCGLFSTNIVESIYTSWIYTSWWWRRWQRWHHFSCEDEDFVFFPPTLLIASGTNISGVEGEWGFDFENGFFTETSFRMFNILTAPNGQLLHNNGIKDAY